MTFQKSGKRKKRRRHGKSILQQGNYCYLCARLRGVWWERKGLHKHHIYGGPNRIISEEQGFWVKLCLEHHEFGPEAAHVNAEIMRLLQKECQKKYEEEHSREQFMGLIGRNYL